MNGEIMVTSEEGKGSDFHFELPLKVAPENDDIRNEERGWEQHMAGASACLVIGHSTLYELLRNYCQTWQVFTRALPKESTASAIAESMQAMNALIVDLGNADPKRAQLAIDAAAAQRLPIVLLNPLTGGRAKDKVKVPEGAFSVRVSKPVKRRELMRILADTFIEVRNPTHRGASLGAPVIDAEPASAAPNGYPFAAPAGVPTLPPMPEPVQPQNTGWAVAPTPQPQAQQPITAPAPLPAMPSLTPYASLEPMPVAPMPPMQMPQPQMPAPAMQMPMQHAPQGISPAMFQGMSPQQVAAMLPYVQAAMAASVASAAAPYYQQQPQAPMYAPQPAPMPMMQPPVQQQAPQPPPAQQPPAFAVRPPVATPLANSSSAAAKQFTTGAADSFAKQYPARILLVDDQPLNHKIVTLFLQRLGYKNVDIAHNGQEGAEMANRGGYDVIFMDLQMPVMGGIESAKEIRGNFLLKNQPAIIAMTGHALSGVKESCMEAGMNDFLTKPVSLDDFRRVIPQSLEAVMAS